MPLIDLDLVHMDCAYSSCYCHIFTFWTKGYACWNLIRLIKFFKLFQKANWFRLFYKIPFIHNSIFTRNNQRVGVRPDGRTDDWSNNWLKKYQSFLLFSINLLELRSFKQWYSCIIIHYNKIVANKIFIVPHFIITNSTLANWWRTTVLLQIRKWDCMNWT